jgi:hypothetical protein
LKNKIRIITVFMISTIIFEGCAVFKGSQQMSMEPFSDNAAILFSEAVKVSRPFQFKNLSTYTEVEEYKTIKEKSIPLIRALKGIVYYSNQLVSIYNSRLKDKQKNEQLALYLQEIFEKAKHKERIDSIGLHKEDVELVLADIRNANKYLDGIAAADPIINTIVLALFDRLDEIEGGVSSIIASFESQIYGEYALAIDNYLRLKDLQNMTMETLTKLYLAQTRDITILDTLLQSDLNLSFYIKSTDNVTQAEFFNAEEYLVNRLGSIDVMLKQLEYERVEYLAKKDEISNWHLQVDEKLSIARNAITIWAQSHRNLGRGIEVPPLLDISTIVNLIGPAVGKAAGNLVP